MSNPSIMDNFQYRNGWWEIQQLWNFSRAPTQSWTWDPYRFFGGFTAFGQPEPWPLSTQTSLDVWYWWIDENPVEILRLSWRFGAHLFFMCLFPKSRLDSLAEAWLFVDASPQFRHLAMSSLCYKRFWSFWSIPHVFFQVGYHMLQLWLGRNPKNHLGWFKPYK